MSDGWRLVLVLVTFAGIIIGCAVSWQMQADRDRARRAEQADREARTDAILDAAFDRHRSRPRLPGDECWKWRPHDHPNPGTHAPRPKREAPPNDASRRAQRQDTLNEWVNTPGRARLRGRPGPPDRDH